MKTLKDELAFKCGGLGYRAPHLSDILTSPKEFSWIEVISENYIGNQSQKLKTLLKLREKFDIALHGISLSMASDENLDVHYLKSLKKLVDIIKPIRISDHLCWTHLAGHHWHNLLPFPYTQENLSRTASKVFEWQDYFQRHLVLENLSPYMASAQNEMTEYEFIRELCHQTGCKILLDLNNMIVNQKNFRIDPYKELQKIPFRHIDQIHLAGHTENDHFAVDTHSEQVGDSTWDLFREVLKTRQDIPYMIEWDEDIPEFPKVLEELKKAQAIHIEAIS